MGGMVAGRLAAASAPEHPAGAAGRRMRRDLLVFGALGAAPDLDLLVGLHSTYSHSLGAVALAIAVAWACRRDRGVRWALACGTALGSHVLLDWLGSDTTAPIGIMALWPFSSEFYQSSVHLFPAVSRRYWQWSFVTQNATAALVEVMVLGPLVWVVTRGRRTPAPVPAED